MTVVETAFVERCLLINSNDDGLRAEVLEHLKLLGRCAKVGNRVELLPPRASRRGSDFLLRD
jgi:hypothetical protein